jgi:hypothetical protein
MYADTLGMGAYKMDLQKAIMSPLCDSVSQIIEKKKLILKVENLKNETPSLFT